LKYEDDYRAARVPMMPVIAGEAATFDLILWYSAITVGVTLLLIPVGGLGWIYAVTAVILAVGLITYASSLRGDRTKAMRFFGFTNVYLAAVFLSMMVDRAVLDTSLSGTTTWLTAGSVFALVGMAMVVTVERGPGMRAPGISAMRHAVEVGITSAFVLGMVVVSWISAAA
jgi:4-hydroxybenzoate polyprenyltransferase